MRNPSGEPWLARRRLLSMLRLSLPAAAMATVVVGLVYVVAQQTLRLTANDLPLTVVQDTVNQLNAGASPAAAVPPSSIELLDSLDTFVLVYDTSGRLLASSARLDGGLPAYPQGVFLDAAARGETRVTWQPAPGVRLASVVKPWQSGMVVGGRSLQTTERVIEQIGHLCLIGWLAALAATLLASALVVLTTEHRLPEQVPLGSR